MVNRNAARHLLLVASILICFFVYMGYRYRSKAEPATDTISNEFASFDESAPPSTSLRPQNHPADPASDDFEHWIPSARGEELALAPAPANSSIPASGGGLIPPPTTTTSSSGAITGLIPAPPSDGQAASMRPSGDSPPPQFMPPVGTFSPVADAGDQLPPSFTPPGGGLKPPSASGTQVVTSLPAPPMDGTASPIYSPEYASEPSGIPAPPTAGASGSVTQMSLDTDDMPASASPAYTYQYEEPEQESPPPAPATRPAPPAGTRPATTPPPARPPQQPAQPVRPVQQYYDEGEDEYDEEDAGPVGSESLRIYVVRSGDTLSNIAARELGSISLADNIFLLNRDVIEDPDQLMVGVKIRLPVRDGYASESAPAAGAGSGRKPTHGTGRTHTVARGDTLSSIAMQYYGTSAGWRFLYEANKTIVPNPNQLSVGTELNIPPYEN